MSVHVKAAAIAVAFTLIAQPDPLAADLGDVKLCLEPGFAYRALEAGGRAPGLGLGGSLALGLDDHFWVEAAGGAAWLADDGRLSRLELTAVYALDVWTAVPSLHLGLGAVHGGRAWDYGPTAGVSLDYFLTSTLIVGAVARYQLLLAQGTFPSLVALSLRAGWWW